MSLRMWILLGLALGAVATALVAYRPMSPAVSRTIEAPALVEATLISPAAGDDGVVVVEPGRESTFTYELKNVGTRPVRRLTVGEACACSAQRVVLDELPLRGTARVSVNFRGPEAGSFERAVPVMAEGEPAPVVVLLATLRAAGKGPRVFAAPEFLRFDGLLGIAKTVALRVDTVEPDWMEERWLDGLQVTPKGLVDAKFVNVSQAVVSEGFRYQSYEFELSLAPGNGALDEPAAQIAVMTGDKGAPPARLIGLRIHVVPPVALVPPTLSFECTSDLPIRPKRVAIVLRGGVRERLEIKTANSDLIRATWGYDTTGGHWLDIQPVHPVRAGETTLVVSVNVDQPYDLKLPIRLVEPTGGQLGDAGTIVPRAR